MKTTVKPLQQKVSSHEQTIHELERVRTVHSSQLSDLDSAMHALKAQLKLLSDKCEDLEGRSRTNNIQVVQVGFGGTVPDRLRCRATEIPSRLDELPILDRAHLTLHAQPKATTFRSKVRFCAEPRGHPEPPLFFTAVRSSTSSTITPHLTLKSVLFLVE